MSRLTARPPAPGPSTVLSASPGGPRPRSRSERGWDRWRYALALAWLVVAVGVVALGEREASWSELKGLVAAGDVEAVRVTGELAGSARGYSVVELGWRDGLLGYRAEAVQVSGREKPPVVNGLPVLRSAPTAQLRALDPDLEVTHRAFRADGGEMLGWRIPNALGLATLVLAVLWLGVLVVGPQPWRATRWAWFWLAFPPVGVLAHLLLSGPTPGVPAPGEPDRRLTGGWAFLAYLALAGALVSGSR